MVSITLTWDYLVWHYTRALANLVAISGNFLWFLYHFFSVPVVIRTLFSPWRRLGETYHGNFDLENFFATLIINTLMRVVGLIVRLALLAIFAGAFVILFIALVATFILWLVLPLILLLTIIAGFNLLF